MTVPPKYTYLVPILEKIAKREGFVDSTPEVVPTSNVGDNFMSDLLRIVMMGQRKQLADGLAEDKLHFLCKLAPENAKRREELQCELLFERESYFYTKIGPQFMAFQAEKGLPEFDQFTAANVSFPQWYETYSEPAKGVFVEIIEDLSPRGFFMRPKKEPMRFEYIAATLRELAKFHAVSFAMKDQRPEEFAEHKKLVNIMEAFLSSENVHSMIYECHGRVIDVLQNDENKEFMRDVQRNIKKYFTECQTPTASEPFGVIIHGDLWNNNILFRKSETSGNIGVCLIDWQAVRYVSPAIDLLYFIFSSTDKSMRDQHYDELLHIYHDQLSNNIRKLGSRPEKLFPYDALIGELQRCGAYAISHALLIVEVCLADSNNVINLDEICDNNDKKFGFVQGLTGQAGEIFAKRVRDCIGDLVRFGYHKNV